MPWIIGMRSTVSSKYSTIGWRADERDALVGLDHHRRLAGRVQVDELVALLPRILAHQLVADALLGEDQPDLARKRAQRELEELPHGAGSFSACGRTACV